MTTKDQITLPEPEELYSIPMDKEGYGPFSIKGYTADTVRALLAAAVAKERERCASIVENADTPDCGGWTACGIAEDIRSGK